MAPFRHGLLSDLSARGPPAEPGTHQRMLDAAAALGFDIVGVG
jgi:hypothetical protein